MDRLELQLRTSLDQFDPVSELACTSSNHNSDIIYKLRDFDREQQSDTSLAAERALFNLYRSSGVSVSVLCHYPPSLPIESNTVSDNTWPWTNYLSHCPPHINTLSPFLYVLSCTGAEL